MEKKIDRRKKYYLILDTETATLPFVSDFGEADRQTIAIAKPLVYDLGWKIIDRKGNTYARKSFLISEIFSVPSIFNTSYYAHKRPIYLERLKNGETSIVTWSKAIEELIADMDKVEGVGAYNSMFDFKKAIPFTELYIKNLYSADFYNWLDFQKNCCEKISNRTMKQTAHNFEKDVFRFRNKQYKLFDIWGLSCQHILNNDDFRSKCKENSWYSASGKYYKTSAEVCYRYLKNNNDFIESHTAIDDADIESEIFATILIRQKNKFDIGIIYFPFKIIGEVDVP